jgi:hypothetical protein
MSDEVSWQSDTAFSASWQADDAWEWASHSCLQVSIGIISAHEAVADFSQTCLHDASLAELPPPSSSLPHATAPATNANNTAEILNFRAKLMKSSR